jgi:ribosome biogenesis GTPase
MRSKQFASNVDQLLIVVAVQPTFSDDLTGRALAGAWSADIAPIIILNKTDLADELPAARARLAPIAALGVDMIELSALEPEKVHTLLAPRLAGHTSLLLGQSGMGKSTLLNALVPDAAAPTREHSTALDTGFQAFGLQHLSREDIIRGFPEFTKPIEECRFYNCTHRQEPGCGVVAALQAGAIDPARYALYQRILEENLAGQQRY